jgi:hypothetical protein
VVGIHDHSQRCRGTDTGGLMQHVDYDFCVGSTYFPHKCIVCAKRTYKHYHLKGIGYLVRVCSLDCAGNVTVEMLEKTYPSRDANGYGVNGNGIDERNVA